MLFKHEHKERLGAFLRRQLDSKGVQVEEVSFIANLQSRSIEAQLDGQNEAFAHISSYAKALKTPEPVLLSTFYTEWAEQEGGK